jgi:hypothetical protein
VADAEDHTCMQTMASPLPGDLEQLLAELTAIETDADALVAGLDDEQFNWSPAPAAWSIAQCLDHLNKADALYMERLQPAVDDARARGLRRMGPIAMSWWGRLFVRSLEPPATIRMKAARAIAPAPRKRKAEVCPEFVRIHTHLRGLIENCADLDLNRARMKNPFVGFVPMRAGTALRVILAHDRRHLSQARRVRATEGFPRS